MRLFDLQFMHILQIRPPLPRLNNSIMNIQIPITLLRASNHLNQLSHRGVNLSINLIMEKITSALDPLRYIAVPEEMERNRPHGFIRVDLMPLQLEAVVAACLAKALELCMQCCL